MNNSMNIINSFNILNNNFVLSPLFFDFFMGKNIGIQRNRTNRSIDIEDRQMFPIFFTLFPLSMEHRYFRKKKISRNRSAARTTVPRTNSSSNRSFSFKGSPLLQNGGNVTLAYSTIKVQIKGNLKNSSHLSVSFYNVNERNKNFFLKYPSCEISVYYYDNF